MIELNTITPDQIRRAAERAKDARLFVAPTSIFRMYRVTNRTNGKTYTVNFYVHAGKRYGVCDCPAQTFCKHLLCAGTVHQAHAKQRMIANQ